MLKLIAKLLGNKSTKDIKRLMPLVEQAKQDWEQLRSLTNDELRQETIKIQNEINESLQGIDGKLATLHRQIADNPGLDIN